MGKLKLHVRQLRVDLFATFCPKCAHAFDGSSYNEAARAVEAHVAEAHPPLPIEYVKHEPGPFVQEGRTDAYLDGELVAKLHKAEVVSSRAKAGRLLVDGRMTTKWAAHCTVPDCSYRTYGRTREEAVKDILRHRQDAARMQAKAH